MDDFKTFVRLGTGQVLMVQVYEAEGDVYLNAWYQKDDDMYLLEDAQLLAAE